MGIEKLYRFYLAFLLLCCGCSGNDMPDPAGTLTDIPYNPVTFEVTYPAIFPSLEVPTDNPMTVDGVALGRDLFYDPILSVDHTVACGNCHLPENNFSDPSPFSEGVGSQLGKRHSMSLLNVGFFSRGLFWDGRSMELEEQALHPIEDPLEMDNTWEEVELRLQQHEIYPEKFRKAFGIEVKGEITRSLVTKALAQFERTITSKGESKFDRVEQGLDVYTDQELLGRDLFFDDNPDVPDAECGHCHNTPLGSSDDFFNNGLTATNDLRGFPDLGKGAVSGSIADNGKFKAPSLRNIAFSAPYMHDGRFSTLDEVIEHYNNGGNFSPNKDPLIRPLGLNNEQKEALKAFILTMSDPNVLNDPTLQPPK